jgi:hypothetical protein
MNATWSNSEGAPNRKPTTNQHGRHWGRLICSLVMEEVVLKALGPLAVAQRDILP